MNAPKTVLIFIALFISLLGSPFATESWSSKIKYVDGTGRFACQSDTDLDKLIKFYVAEDNDALKKLIRTGACFQLNAGDPVYFEDWTWSGKIKIRLKGSTDSIWTIREAVTDKPPDSGRPIDISISSSAGITQTPQVGLGNTMMEFEKAWNKGYRKEYRLCEYSNIIWLGTSKESSISYITGLVGSVFGNPERIGRISGGTKGLFGAKPDQNATRAQFITEIKNLMPPDSKLISAHSRKKGYAKETYIFKSEALSTLPDIMSAFSYDKAFGTTPGTFTLYINYDIDDSNLVENYTLCLGKPAKFEISEMVKVKKPEF